MALALVLVVWWACGEIGAAAKTVTPPEGGELWALCELSRAWRPAPWLAQRACDPCALWRYGALDDVFTDRLDVCDVCPLPGVSCTSGHVSSISLPYEGLSGTIPRALSALSNLESLVLPGNRLRGDLPQGLKSLRSLRVIDLSHNYITGRADFTGTKVELCNLGCLVSGPRQTEVGPPWAYLALAVPFCLMVRFVFGHADGAVVLLLCMVYGSGALSETWTVTMLLAWVALKWLLSHIRIQIVPNNHIAQN
eukprot:m51a1_g2607 putative leucine-rich repeat protein kinase family protein isoform 2 (252) ;mRNA; f:473602-474618